MACKYGWVSKDIALFEFDPDVRAVLDPSDTKAHLQGTIPERAVLCFYSEILASIATEAVQVGELEAAHGVYPIWKVKRHGYDVAIFHPGVGAPLAACFLEEAIVLGARKVVACGGCGGLSPDLSAGQIIVPTEAVRDEGTSFHYLAPSRTVAGDPDGIATTQQFLSERSVPFVSGKIWTTDALYRETKQKVARRLEEGCLAVDMEAAAFFAVSRFRGIRFAQLLYAGDDLSGAEWDERSWTVSPSRQATFDLAVELVTRL